MSIGIKYAKVLPEPVGEHASKSLPPMRMGIACICMGVAILNPRSAIFEKRYSGAFSSKMSSKEEIGAGASCPVTLIRQPFLSCLISVSSSSVIFRLLALKGLGGTDGGS